MQDPGGVDLSRQQTRVGVHQECWDVLKKAASLLADAAGRNTQQKAQRPEFFSATCMAPGVSPKGASLRKGEQERNPGHRGFDECRLAKPYDDSCIKP